MRLLGAQLPGAGHERADVLGQAAAAEPDSGVEELAADPVVVADGVGELDHVGAGCLAHLGHGVDERDLGGQEGVRRHLDQLGGGEVGHQAGCARGERAGIHLVQQRDVGLRGRAVHSVDEPVGRDGVLDREALTQELRIPGEPDLPALGGTLLEVIPQLGGRGPPEPWTCRPPGR